MEFDITHKYFLSRRFLGRLLGEVSQKLGGSKLVLVVDALDEVDLNLQSPGSNVLYLPEFLPTGVYFIISKCPGSLPLPDNHFLFNLMQPNSDYYDKACIYALQDNVELSVKNLRRAIELEPERYRELAKTDADFDGIRDDVRFQDLLLG